MRYRRILRLFGRTNAVERELDEELALHEELRAAELERRGMTAASARAEARRRLGDRRKLYGSARNREERVRRAEWLATVRQDIVLAVRRSANAPGATVLALLTFALGIGLTTAGFAVVDGVLLRPLPLPRSDELVALESVDSLYNSFPRVAAAGWREWSAHNRTLAVSALHEGKEFTIGGEGRAVRVQGEAVVGDFFGVLGVPLVAGRAFSQEEVKEGGTLVVVTERLWRRVVGGAIELPRAVRLDGYPFTITGVLPDRYAYPAGTELWAGYPSYESTSPEAQTWINYAAIARLAPGVTVEAAEADLSRIARGIRESNPRAIFSYGVGVTPLRELVVADARRSLLLLSGAVAFLLLIACANLAGLGFARTAARTPELSVRVALGAGRGRLVRQLVTESLTIAIVGGAAGVLVAWGAVRLIAGNAASAVPRAQEIALDLRVLGFALAVSLAAGVAAGLAPALRASTAALRLNVRGGVRGGRRLPGAALVAFETALALVLLTGGGLLLRSFQVLLSRDLGFRAEEVVSTQLGLPVLRYDSPEKRSRFWEELSARLRASPGVAEVGFANWVPGAGGGTGFVEVDGIGETDLAAGYRVISDDYLAVLGVPLLAGRGFDRTDGPQTERVGLVNRTMADRYWPEGNAIGGRMRSRSMELMEGVPWIRVIGIVGDVRHDGYEADPYPEMYVLYRQVPSWTPSMHIVARARPGVSTSRLSADVDAAVRALDPELAPAPLALDRRIAEQMASRRLVLAVLIGFAALALVLAALGLYGLLSFAVAQRTREIGVRAALGARRTGIVGLMLGSGLRVVLAGAVAGLVASFWLTRLLQAMLVDITPHDPLTFAAAIAVLFVVATVAALVPAWRAARVDPLQVLRES